MVNRANITQKLIEMKQKLSCMKNVGDEYSLKEILRNVSSTINENHLDMSYSALESLNYTIDKWLEENIDFEDIKGQPVSVMQERLFYRLFNSFHSEIDSKNRQELVLLQNKKYDELLENSKIFEKGHTLVGDLNKAFFDMNQKELDSFFKQNNVKRSNKHYIEYMSDDLLRFYIVCIDFANDECLVQKKYVKDKFASHNQEHESRRNIIYNCTKSKSFYKEIFEITPLEELKNEAFAQQAIKGIFKYR